jgi:signal transduction histidine kinase
MGAYTGELGRARLLLAELLARDAERISERIADLMKERLPSYAGVPRGELVPTALANIRALLPVIRDPDEDRSRALGIFQSSGEAGAHQGITSDEILDSWRIALEVLREAAYAVGREVNIGSDTLLAFVEAALRWGDVAMRTSGSAHRKARARELKRLAAEQAALRRVATQVARGIPSETAFALVAEQVAHVLGVPSVRIVSYAADGTAAECARHFVGGKPLAWDRVSVADAPIVVDGTVRGAIIVSSPESEPLPPDTKARLMDFSELAAAAIYSANARAEVERLAQEQAALRRVATLVAGEQSSKAVLVAVAKEVALLLSADAGVIDRFEPDEYRTVVESWGKLRDAFVPGSRWKLEAAWPSSLVYRTSRSVRLEDLERLSGGGHAEPWRAGLHDVVGAPILVNGRLWGALVAATSQPEAFPDGAESRIARFAELLATSLVNIQAREDAELLAQEQAALLRVATLVAQRAAPEEVFMKVCEEVGPLVGAEAGLINRFDADGYCTTVGSSGKLREAFPSGSRWRVAGSGGASELVYRTGRPARRQYDGPGSIATEARRVGLRSAVGSPIFVGGRVWASLVVATPADDGLPADAEPRIAQFADLVATSIANVQAQSDLEASRARIVAAAGEERHQVVLDLQDGAQQHLTRTLLAISLARRALAQDATGATALVREALQHAETANDSLRELAHGILPAILARDGLSAAVQALATRMPFPVKIDMPLGRLSDPVEATAYFVVAEALAGVAKHARADRAAVTARLDDHTLQLEVRHGGARADGPGLLRLRDRLAALDGHLHVASATGGGTVVAATIPIGDHEPPRSDAYPRGQGA